MSKIQQFDKVEARFTPKRIDDLRAGAHQFIGEIAEFRALWVIEDGPYEGQWAMEVPRNWDARSGGEFVWSPECDLSPVVAAHPGDEHGVA